jgi:pyroglutamyl-peptidase
MKILITGFNPFLGESVNPSEQIALELSRSESGVQVFILPVEFKKSFEILEKEIEKNQPDFLIMIGQATGR